jgi:hypothetical protein
MIRNLKIVHDYSLSLMPNIQPIRLCERQALEILFFEK